jgi:hypothetical protein
MHYIFSPNLFHSHSLATSPSQHLNLSSLSLSLNAFLDEPQQLATVPTLDCIVWREGREEMHGRSKSCSTVGATPSVSLPKASS